MYNFSRKKWSKEDFDSKLDLDCTFGKSAVL